MIAGEDARVEPGFFSTVGYRSVTVSGRCLDASGCCMLKISPMRKHGRDNHLRRAFSA